MSVRMVGAVASCTVKGPGTPARGYPVGCKPRRREGTGKVCGGAEEEEQELQSGGRRREREGERERERESEREREREREGEGEEERERERERGAPSYEQASRDTPKRSGELRRRNMARGGGSTGTLRLQQVPKNLEQALVAATTYGLPEGCHL